MLILVLMVGSGFLLLPSASPQAVAVELSYDNGVASGISSQANVAVQFFLPPEPIFVGVTQMRLLTVRFQASGAGEMVGVDVLQPDRTSFSPAISTEVLSAAAGTWKDVQQPPGPIVPVGFFVKLTFTGSGVFDSGPNGGHSFEGPSITTPCCSTGSGNLLVRAIVQPIFPSIVPEYPLGLPILAILTVIAYGIIRKRRSKRL